MIVIPECPICLGEDDSDYCVITCGHVYHRLCITNWLGPRQFSACPQCRASFGRDLMIKLFVESMPQNPPASQPSAAHRVSRPSRRSLEVDLVAVHESLTKMVEEGRKQIREKDNTIQELQGVLASTMEMVDDTRKEIREKDELIQQLQGLHATDASTSVRKDTPMVARAATFQPISVRVRYGQSVMMDTTTGTSMAASTHSVNTDADQR